MIVVRHTFQAKYGKGDELVAILKEMNSPSAMPQNRGRILTDASGQFFTVIHEFEVESLSAWERMFCETSGRPEFGQWFARTVPLIESGRRDFYTVVA